MGSRLRTGIIVAALFVAIAPLHADVTLVSAFSQWRYLDDGSNQGTAWRQTSFDDSSWKSGIAEFGYGDGDEATIVSYGADQWDKHITTYFRRSISVADPQAFLTLKARLIRDDGAVVYVNGAEVWRANMPAGSATWVTPAASTIAGADEYTWIEQSIPAWVLVAGKNTIAVEIHQSDGYSSDLSFNFELVAGTTISTVQLTRGPYLQLGTPSSVIVHWRTDVASDGRVRYGTSPATLSHSVDNPTRATEHTVSLTNLAPETLYYYSVGTTSETIAGDETYSFRTAPVAGTATPIRVWALGDPGTADAYAASVRDAFYRLNGSPTPSLWLTLGDNAYDYGRDAEFQRAIFEMYPQTLRSSVLWPSIGNHDTYTVSFPYAAIFDVPTRGEAGGVASGSERYYSFDYGNVHFVCLDSMTSSRSPAGAMLTWLRADLSATMQEWIIAYFHHAPYSKGTHDSDQEDEMIEMRANAGPILEAGGVDLVLTGHSHSYERSYLLDGHYGMSWTFDESMKVDGGDGRVGSGGAYRKPLYGAHNGTVYTVAGSAGWNGPGELDHPAMYTGISTLGSVVLDINGDRLDATFLRANGTMYDQFTIVKGEVPAPPAAPSFLKAKLLNNTTVALSWTDNSANESGFYVERCAGSTCTNFVRIATVAANATTFMNSGLRRRTYYRYRVSAFNDAGVSAKSNVVTIRTY